MAVTNRCQPYNPSPVSAFPRPVARPFFQMSPLARREMVATMIFICGRISRERKMDCKSKDMCILIFCCQTCHFCVCSSIAIPIAKSWIAFENNKQWRCKVTRMPRDLGRKKANDGKADNAPKYYGKRCRFAICLKSVLPKEKLQCGAVSSKPGVCVLA